MLKYNLSTRAYHVEISGYKLYLIKPQSNKAFSKQENNIVLFGKVSCCCVGHTIVCSFSFFLNITNYICGTLYLRHMIRWKCIYVHECVIFRQYVDDNKAIVHSETVKIYVMLFHRIFEDLGINRLEILQSKLYTAITVLKILFRIMLLAYTIGCDRFFNFFRERFNIA